MTMHGANIQRVSDLSLALNPVDSERNLSIINGIIHTITN